MYINHSLLESKGLSPADFTVLCAIKQSRIEDLSTYLENNLTEVQIKTFEEISVLEWVKETKKNNNLYKRIRINSVGNALIEDLTTPEVTETDLKMRDYLCDIYLSHEDKERTLGNKKLIGVYCAEFRNYLNLSPYEMYWLCFYFLQEFSFTKKLENIFLDRNKNRYGKFLNNIQDSKLFQFYEEKTEEIKAFWRQQIKTENENNKITEDEKL